MWIDEKQYAEIARHLAAGEGYVASSYRANPIVPAYLAAFSTMFGSAPIYPRIGQALIGALGCVSHCYRRPRHLPDWPYNLFAMVHGRARAEVEGKVQQIAGVLGDACRAHEVLYSTRILKKTGLRLSSC